MPSVVESLVKPSTLLLLIEAKWQLTPDFLLLFTNQVAGNTVTSQLAILINVKICEVAWLWGGGWSVPLVSSKFSPNKRREQVGKDEKNALLSWISPCEATHWSNCCTYFEGRFPGLLAHTGMLQEKKNSLLTNKYVWTEGTAECSARSDVFQNHKLELFFFLSWWECFNGTFPWAGPCNTSVGFGTVLWLSWTQWGQQSSKQEVDATTEVGCDSHTVHNTLTYGGGGSRANRLACTTLHFTLNTAQMVVKLLSLVILTLFSCSCHVVRFFEYAHLSCGLRADTT